MKQVFRLFCLCLFACVMAYAEPNVHQVYEAAKAGKLSEARTMIDEVIKEHPQSAKAHFVNAELLSAQGQITQARSELSLAEKLEPGLPFAKPEAVQKLKENLGLTTNTKVVPTSKAEEKSSFSWMTIIMIGAGIALLVILVRSFSNRNQSYQAPQNPSSPMNPMGGNAPMPPQAPQGGGLGSSLASGLATGVGVGVGIAAGEALVNHFVNGNNSASSNANHTAATPTPNTTPSPSSEPDFGGNDFGINDTSSWDDGVSDSSDSSGDSW